MLLSFCVITKNEEHNLSRCLNSVKNYIDELVVVDTGSTDQTLAIAEQYGARILHFQWCDSFAKARNFALQQIRSEWVLFLDADEEMVITDINFSFSSLLNNSKIDGYQIEIQEFYLKNETNHTGIKLYRHSDSYYVGDYHEIIVGLNNIQLLNGIHLVHYGYSPNALATRAKERIRLLEKLTNNPEILDLNLMLTLEGLYREINQLEKAEDCYQKVYDYLLPKLITQEKPDKDRGLQTWLLMLGLQTLNTNDYDLSSLIAQVGLQWFPNYPPLLYLNGKILSQLSFYGGAIFYYKQCFQCYQQLNDESFDKGFISYLPAYELVVAYHYIKNDQLAMFWTKYLLKIKELYPKVQELLDRIAMLQ